MPMILMVGTTDGGIVSLMIEDATWRTIASVADGITAASRQPITWTCHRTITPNVNRALIEAGYGDRPVQAPVPLPV
jgi:hypothetical protein